MLQPKKRKHTKEFRGRMRGLSLKGAKVAFGEFGLQSVDRGWLNSRQIEAARRAIVGFTKRKGKLWIKIFPQKPITEKSSEVKRGGGKGVVKEYVAVIKPGRVLFELGGLNEDVAKRALELAAQKLSLKTRFIKK